jgi:hypothetical protein
MARALIPLVILLAVAGFVAYGIWAGGRRRTFAPGAQLPPHVRELPPADQETWKLGQEMARLLERGLVDPVERQSSHWEAQAKELVDRWHGTP